MACFWGRPARTSLAMFLLIAPLPYPFFSGMFFSLIGWFIVRKPSDIVFATYCIGLGGLCKGGRGRACRVCEDKK
jgi:hypothetical protein